MSHARTAKSEHKEYTAICKAEPCPTSLPSHVAPVVIVVVLTCSDFLYQT
jgi:hypothetical protein